MKKFNIETLRSVSASSSSIIESSSQGGGNDNSWMFPSELIFNMSIGTLSLEQSFNVRIKNYPPAYSLADHLFYRVEFNIDELEPLEFELEGFFSFGNRYVFPEDYGQIKELVFKVNNTHLLLGGTYNVQLKVTVYNFNMTEMLEEYYIPITINVIDTSEISHNLSNKLNYCLDDLKLKISSSEAKFVRLYYEVNIHNKLYNFSNEYAIINNELEIEFTKAIQPYIYLREKEIDSFFEDLKLDISPADVKISVTLLNSQFQTLKEENLGEFKFHAGSSSNLIEYGSVVERSLNYNTHLPLVYRYPEELVNFKFKNLNKSYNKQEDSFFLNIFQMMFLQKYHFAEEYGSAFSSGFSNGFNNPLLQGNEDLYSFYEEGYINLIESNYTIKGYNLPLQVESFNVIWLDENNHFNGMTFTGVRKDTNEYNHLINQFSKSVKNIKAGATKSTTINMNTGFILNSEIPLIDSLLKSQRCWLFKDDIKERIEVIAQEKKAEYYNSMNDLTSFDIEFKKYE